MGQRELTAAMRRRDADVTEEGGTGERGMLELHAADPGAEARWVEDEETARRPFLRQGLRQKCLRYYCAGLVTRM